jgi:hypothetical protein
MREHAVHGLDHDDRDVQRDGQREREAVAGYGRVVVMMAVAVVVAV